MYPNVCDKIDIGTFFFSDHPQFIIVVTRIAIMYFYSITGRIHQILFSSFSIAASVHSAKSQFSAS